MIKLMSRELNELYEFVSYYATKNKLRDDIIEKDLWNCYFLDYLFSRSQYKDYFIFKGGTSLSKCYNLINRYSEDLDVVLDSNILGINLEEKIESLTSRNQKEKFVKKINAIAMDFISNKLIPIMKEECEKEIGKKLEFELIENDLAFYITYPHIASYGYVEPRVKIEMSSLSAIIPTEITKIEPYVNGVIKNEDLKVSFNVKSMKPERTFWEKALILHQEANRIDGEFPNRYSRHYYDLYKIYNSNKWNETINNLKLLDEVRKFTITFYNRGWSKFEEAKPGSFKLYPNDKYIKDLEKDYKLMAQMIFNEQPSFNEVMKVIKEIEKEINKL